MDLVLPRHPSKNVAVDRGISQRTVENHQALIMKETGTKSLPDMARLALAAAKKAGVDSFHPCKNPKRVARFSREHETIKEKGQAPESWSFPLASIQGPMRDFPPNGLDLYSQIAVASIQEILVSRDGKCPERSSARSLPH